MAEQAVQLLLLGLGERRQDLVLFSATYSLYFLLQKLAGPVYLSQIGSVAAVAGAALAVIGLGEAAPPILALAMPATLAGAWLVNRTR